ncbi:MAG: DUF3726 domain-containing protein [Rhodospirillaceae bacterium]|nr:DUF3726 domain-containing protein [Rhodospirillaceae bacterium]MCY4239562.1 DUF3726 domain-containing protein [Rhodospirillaceae bacterium]
MTGFSRDRTREPLLCSRNEINGLAMKAARGAGLPWGLAEEAGWAACWLESRRLGGMSALASNLEALASEDWSLDFPEPSAGEWRAVSGITDGLLAGVTLADRAGLDLNPSVSILVLRKVRWPILMVPFLAEAVCPRHVALELQVEEHTVSVGIFPHGVDRDVEILKHKSRSGAVFLEARDLDKGNRAVLELDGSIPIDQDAYARLEYWAHKTCVPESAESRQKGAGGGELIETD